MIRVLRAPYAPKNLLAHIRLVRDRQAVASAHRCNDRALSLLSMRSSTVGRTRSPIACVQFFFDSLDMSGYERRHLRFQHDGGQHMRKHSALIVALSVALFFNLTAAAQAGLMGATVNVTPYYPNTSSPFASPGDTVVTAGIEYPFGSFPTHSPRFSIDVSDTQLIISFSGDSAGPFGAATFNGFIMTVVSGALLTSATSNAGSSFFPVGVSIVGDQLLLNYSGVVVPALGVSIIDIGSAAVPEPSALALICVLLLSLFGLGVLRRHRA